MKRLALAALLFAANLPVHAAPNVKEGEWEMTMKMEMNGQTVPAQSIKYCVTKDNLVPKAERAEQSPNCTKVEPKVSGDTVSWSTVCKQSGQTIESTGRITYKGDTFTGEINSTMTGEGGQPMKMRQVMSGRRVGECRK
ncbi:MAG TPA: DUF3617 family protein [Pelomicrobium sp.]|nr:DUF3617 family protein [Pelomicrobium sp.]